MPGLVIGGAQVEVPGVRILNWFDNPILRMSPEDGAVRKNRWVRQVILHTTKGIPGGKNNTPQSVRTGVGPDSGKDFDVAKYWSKSNKSSGAHIIIDSDGSASCIADLTLEKMYHAGNRTINDQSIGIEIYQLQDGSIWESSLKSCVLICNMIADYLGIQKQYHAPYKGPVFRLSQGASDCVGFFGHRDLTNNRGQGDPGDFIFQMLSVQGYEEFDFSKTEDIDVWKARQSHIGASSDGIPGPKTVQLLRESGFLHGIYANGVIEKDNEVNESQITEEIDLQQFKSSLSDRINEVISKTVDEFFKG